MFKRILTVAIVSSVLMACSSTNEQVSDEKLSNIITAEQAKALPRDERLARILNDMSTIDSQQIKISRLVDPISESIFSVFKNQKNVITEHKVLLDNHRDVQSFIMANQGKTQKELMTEAKRFDLSIEDENQKISPRLKAYEEAGKKLDDENKKLAVELAKQAVGLAEFFSDKGSDLLGAAGLVTLLNVGKLDDAYNLAEKRIQLANLANDFIKDQQAIIDITKLLQSQQNDKL